MRVRLKRNHYHDGNLKRPGSIIDLHPVSASHLVRLGVAEESAPPAARNPRKK